MQDFEITTMDAVLLSISLDVRTKNDNSGRDWCVTSNPFKNTSSI